MVSIVEEPLDQSMDYTPREALDSHSHQLWVPSLDQHNLSRW